MRVEQLYPVPLKALVQELGRFKSAELVWCQEEPRNMGAFLFVRDKMQPMLDASRRVLRYAGRPEAAATATGMFDGMQYIGGAAVGSGMGWLLEHYGWGTWGPSMIGFSAIGAILMLRLWNAVPHRTVEH